MNFITEDISEYIEGVNTVDDLINKPGSHYIYHRTNADLANVRNTGMSREFQGGNGQVFGYGLYCSLRLRDCVANRGYGKHIIKIWVPSFDRCLINPGCDVHGHDLAELVHGKDAPMNRQIRKLFKPEFAEKYRFINDLHPFQQANNNIEAILQENDIDGIIYDWGGGHWVCVWKDYKKAFPLAFSDDDGRTFKSLGNETTIKNVLQTWEPNRVLGTDILNYQDAENARVVNGYLKVHNNKGFNFIDPKQGKNPISQIWFQNASDADDNGMATIKFNGKTFWYYIPDDEIYEIDGDDTQMALMMGDVLGHSKDLPMLTIKQAMEETTGIFSNILKENVNEYIPGADRNSIHDKDNNGLVCFYRLSKPEQLKSIATNGFTKEFRGTGDDNSDALGSGTYGVVNPSWNVIPKYGNILWRYGTPASLVANTYISPDPYLAQRFGIEGTFAEQLERFFPDLVPLWKKKGVWNYIIKPKYNPGASRPSGSLTIRVLNDTVFNGIGGRSDHFYHSHGINGIIYHGDYDGDAVVTFDDSTLIPIAWRDNSKRGDEWHKNEITDTLWNRTFNGFDPLAFLKGTYKDYEDNPNNISNNYRVVNGYMKVRRKKDGKYNYIKAPEGGRNFASQIWFDNASDLDENGVGIIKFNGKTFWYYPQDDEVYEITCDDPQMALMLDEPIGTSKDLPSLTMKPAMEENKGVFGNLIKEILKKH